jgi:hypothetical protein
MRENGSYPQRFTTLPSRTQTKDSVMTRPLPKIDVVDDETAAKYRSMTVAEKIQLVRDLNRQARARAATRLKMEHPDWTDELVLAEVARLMLSGDEEYFE